MKLEQKRQGTAALQDAVARAERASTFREVLECGCPLPLSRWCVAWPSPGSSDFVNGHSYLGKTDCV